MSLQPHEWPAESLPRMSDRIIATAQKVRSVTGCSMVPSPDPEAHVRYSDGTSQHCIGEDGRGLSKATDVFLRGHQVDLFWTHCQRVPEVGGFGLYFDTKLGGKPRVLAHIDIRDDRILWVCPSREPGTPREYIYFHHGPVRYLQTLADELTKLAG